MFRSDFHGGIRLTVAGRPLLLKWPGGGNDIVSQPIRLEAGHLYPIKVEYQQLHASAMARLMWVSRRQQPEAIPHSATFRSYSLAAAVTSVNLAEGKSRPASPARCAQRLADRGGWIHRWAHRSKLDRAHRKGTARLVAGGPANGQRNRFDRALSPDLDPNRATQLNNFYVFVSDVCSRPPDLDAVRKQEGVFQFHQADKPATSWWCRFIARDDMCACNWRVKISCNWPR